MLLLWRHLSGMETVQIYVSSAWKWEIHSGDATLQWPIGSKASADGIGWDKAIISQVSPSRKEFIVELRREIICSKRYRDLC